MTHVLPFPFRRLWLGYSSRPPVFFLMSSGMVRPMLWAALPTDRSWPVGSGLCTSAEGWLCPGSSRSCVGKRQGPGQIMANRSQKSMPHLTSPLGSWAWLPLLTGPRDKGTQGLHP